MDKLRQLVDDTGIFVEANGSKLGKNMVAPVFLILYVPRNVQKSHQDW